MKKLIFSALFMSLGMVGALASAQPAHAASSYDSVITSVDNLNINCYSYVDSSFVGTQDLSYNWSNALNPSMSTMSGSGEPINRVNSSGGTYVTNVWDTLQDRLNDGQGWTVLNQSDGSSYDRIYFYVQTTIASPTFPGSDYIRYSNSYLVQISCRQDGILVDYGSADTTRNNYIMGARGTPYEKFYFMSNTITYPSGYEGELIAEAAPTPGVSSDYVPDWYASEAVNWVVSLHDQNFNTFDGIEWTCSEDGNSIIEGGDGLAPVLYWQVWRDDFPTEGENLLIDDGYQSATAPVMVELPINRDEAREYRVAGWYECGGDVDFTDASNFTFIVNKGGVLDESSALSDCISEEFPFIHLDDCISNLAIFGKIALFGGATFNNNWTASTDCTTLNTMDDWLHLENPTVCPMMPSYVRNIVTPFITFILGLITMRFLATRTGKDF